MAFGEVALVDRAPRSATVRTLTAVKAFALSFADYDQLAAEGRGTLTARLLANLARVLAARLRGANAEIESLRA